MDELQARKTEIDADLLRMTRRWRRDYERDYTPASLEVFDSLTDVLNRGGKRTRGSLAMESYYLHGGADKAVALATARIIELIQAYLLVIDDIQDRSSVRRGGPTVHAQLTSGHDEQYGTAQAMNASLLASSRAISELIELAVNDDIKVKALESLNRNVDVTIHGQINDLYNQTTTKLTEKDIIATLAWKTAYYTFVSPMELGACLAGVTELGDRLRNYAVNAGIAFQIHDDIAGVFGDSKKLGKRTDDDIREGKATLMVYYARNHATRSQQKLLYSTLGNTSAKAEKCDEVRNIFEMSGAKRYAEEQLAVYIDSAQSYVRDSSEDVLTGLLRQLRGEIK